MMWSPTGSRIFDKCQIQWFLKTFFANANAKKDLLRREAYILSKLQTLYAWRGNLVDHVISWEILPLIEKGWALNQERLLQIARSLFDRQKDFALKHRIREEGFSVSKAGSESAAFIDIEYGLGVTATDLEKAWSDVEKAISNLLQMKALLEDLRKANRLITQRPLPFTVLGQKAKARPDLICFYSATPPTIVDWKVHTFGTTDYRLQLAAYALAVERCEPHSDFPRPWQQWSATDMRLLEVQLLTGVIREYRINEGELEELEERIVSSSTRMKLALGEMDGKTLNVSALTPAENPETCERCAFRKICWEEFQCAESKQMTLL